MPELTLGDALNLGVELHRAGRIGDAESVYRQILARFPDHPDALHLLGVTCQQQGRGDEALRLLERAVALSPGTAMFQANFARALKDQGRAAEAVVVFERALALEPNAPDAVLDYAKALHAQGRLSDAVSAYRRAVTLASNFREAHDQLGALLLETGAFAEAAEALAQANRIEPRPATCANLGSALQALSRLDEAIITLRQWVQLAPTDPAAHRWLGVAHWQKGDGPPAIEAYREAVKLDPRDAEAFSHLGNLLLQSYDLGASVDASRRAIELNPARADAHTNLGIALLRQGRIRKAIDASRQAVRVAPKLAGAHSNLLLALNYDDTATPEDVFAEHVRFGERFGEQAGWSPAPHDNDRSPDRRLRIGYVSPDFRDHPVARFMEPILAGHDPAQVEVLCYASEPHADAVTERLRRCNVVWRPIHQFSDDRCSALIRADRIDILVDLAGHTALGRPTLFARKPAPVQVTYLGYPNTTGLREIDYRITDAKADPPGKADALNVERLVRLPDTAWCYSPPADAPDVNELPPLSAAGRVTFGSFNAIPKLSASTIELWSTLLDRVPESRLLLKAASFLDRETRERVAAAFGTRGIGEDRLILRPAVIGVAGHLGTYHDVDVALDPTPYNGTTTTCEALWMGVPVVTLVGRAHASRVGASLLTTIGLSELVATTREEFLQIATDLATDLPKLKDLRGGLRDRMRRSPLTDGPRFVRDLEKAYRAMWEEWCRA
jgi:predicted O-linked N-acetylglucosamine transferase (SPINDLY family)